LALVVIAATYGLANRTEADERWLIIPILISCMFASVALERAIRAIDGAFPRVDKRVLLLAPVLAFVIPLYAVATHYSAHDRSSDTRDQVNGETILSAMAPGAVVWSYWDVRTTLEYLTQVKHFRPDVQVLDHRMYARYGCAGCEGLGDASVALGVATDPLFISRPFYYLPIDPTQHGIVAARLRLDPVVQVDLPSGSDYRGTGWLYLVRR
jgi:hypothetical protein